jgi:exonuclease III
METETKQRYNETTEVTNQMVLTDIYQTLPPKTKEYTFFSAPHGTFSKIDHIVRHKTSFNRYKKIDLIPYILSDHHRLRMVFNNSKNNRKPTYSWKAKQFFIQ